MNVIGGVVVIAETQVEDEMAAHSPIVLDEAAKRIDVRGVERHAERRVDRLWDVRERVGSVWKSKSGFCAVSSWPASRSELKTGLDQASIDRAAELLV